MIKGATATQDTGSTSERILTRRCSCSPSAAIAARASARIERAAGLASRSGALYKHFEGKEDVLERAIERHLEAIDDLGTALDMLPLGDLRAELTLLARAGTWRRWIGERR